MRTPVNNKNPRKNFAPGPGGWRAAESGCSSFVSALMGAAPLTRHRGSRLVIAASDFKLWAECWVHCLPSPRANCPHYIPTTASEWSRPLDMDIVWLYSAITAAPQQEAGNRNTAVEFISRCQLIQGVPMPTNDIYSRSKSFKSFLHIFHICKSLKISVIDAGPEC